MLMVFTEFTKVLMSLWSNCGVYGNNERAVVFLVSPLFCNRDLSKCCCEVIQLKAQNMASELKVIAPGGLPTAIFSHKKRLSMEINILQR